jgi:hypothetical protein
MITYTWDIFRLDCAPSENGLMNVVKTIHWILNAQDENGTSASFNNSYPLPSPSPEAFTEYSTLTKETVYSWLESNLDIGYLHTYLANEIANKYIPPITPLPLPWVKVEEPVLEVVEEPVAVQEPVPTEPTLEEMIADGYNPDAKDGDGDGILQEGTDWERPIDNQS